jgi:hypothetical protein
VRTGFMDKANLNQAFSQLTEVNLPLTSLKTKPRQAN